MAPAALYPAVRRRHYLRATVAFALAAAAGCAGGGTGDGSDGGATPPPTTTPTPGEPETSFTVTSASCGAQANRADVSFEAGTVTVEGTTWGNEACYAARLASATLDGGTLTLRVVTFRTADEDQACAQCIAEIEYRATVETTTAPDEVVVVHDGEMVATASP